MNTHYSKDDIVDLASTIFVNDINSDTVAASGITTEAVAESSFYAAEVFFNAAAAYQRGEMTEKLNRCHNLGTPTQCGQGDLVKRSGQDRRSNVDRRGVQEKGCAEKGDPRETSPEEDEAFARLEQALKAQFLMATFSDIFRNAEHKG